MCLFHWNPGAAIIPFLIKKAILSDRGARWSGKTVINGYFRIFFYRNPVSITRTTRRRRASTCNRGAVGWLPAGQGRISRHQGPPEPRAGGSGTARPGPSCGREGAEGRRSHRPPRSRARPRPARQRRCPARGWGRGARTPPGQEEAEVPDHAGGARAGAAQRPAAAPGAAGRAGWLLAARGPSGKGEWARIAAGQRRQRRDCPSGLPAPRPPLPRGRGGTAGGRTELGRSSDRPGWGPSGCGDPPLPSPARVSHGRQQPQPQPQRRPGRGLCPGWLTGCSCKQRGVKRECGRKFHLRAFVVLLPCTWTAKVHLPQLLQAFRDSVIRNNKGKHERTMNLKICWRVGQCDITSPEPLLTAGRGGSLILFYCSY